MNSCFPDAASQATSHASCLDGLQAGDAQGRHTQECLAAYVSALLCYSLARKRNRFANDTNASRPSQCENDCDLHTCLAIPNAENEKSVGSTGRFQRTRERVMGRHRLEVADVFRKSGLAFLDKYQKSLSFEQHRALRAIMLCRTNALGGHVQKCNGCGHVKQAYNSCRNRHCPKCQAKARADWMDARAADLLPVPLNWQNDHQATSEPLRI